MKCLLGEENRNKARCGMSDCRTCGWNAQVDFDLREHLHKHGLIKGRDGLKRLVTKKKRR